MKYRKKPIVIEAIQITRTNGVEVGKFMQFTDEELARIQKNEESQYETAFFTIKTLEGSMLAGPGDYIIRGIKGELYPCKADIFEASYEAVVE